MKERRKGYMIRARYVKKSNTWNVFVYRDSVTALTLVSRDTRLKTSESAIKVGRKMVKKLHKSKVLT